MGTIELKPHIQSAPETRAERDIKEAPTLHDIEATQVVSREQVARQLVRDRIVDQRQEAQLYQTEWSPNEAKHRASQQRAAGSAASASRIDEARAQLTHFLAQRYARRQRGSIEERELKRLTELYGEASESLLHLRLTRRGAKGDSRLETNQEELAVRIEKPKEGCERVAPLELGGSEAHEAQALPTEGRQHTPPPHSVAKVPVTLRSSITVQKHARAEGEVTPENSRAALQALLADIAQISPAPRRRS